MSALALMTTAILGVLLGMTAKDDKPEYGIPLVFVLIFHIILVTG